MDEFPLERGLRQSDPLPPFLFLLTAEGLNVLMTTVERAHLFNGYGIGANAEVRLTHLQFADDTLIIDEKSWLNIRTMRSVLLLFGELSGVKVNFNKSMLTDVNIEGEKNTRRGGGLNCVCFFFVFSY